MTETDHGQRGGGGRIAAATAAPLAVTALAYALSSISDRLLYVGPLDRAAFGWVFVVPIWLSAGPIAAALWSRLAVRDRRLAATIVATVIGIGAGVLYFLGAAFPDCETGRIWTSEAVAARGLMLGAVVGISPAIAGLAGASRGGGQTSKTLIVATIVSVVMARISLFVLAMFMSLPSCQRPSIVSP